jgi:hypothetical protein
LIWTVSVVFTLGAVDLHAPTMSQARAETMGASSSAAITSCSLSTLSQPFTRWLDYADYELAPGGDFETATWTMTGGAKLVAGSEPYAVTGTLGSSSLSLPSGSSAQSPVTCVDVTDPSIRFFVAGSGSVAVNLVDGSSTIPAGVVAAGGAWTPTPVMLTSSPALGASSGGAAQVSVSFTGLSGSPRVDDVFVDPWSRG